MLHVQSSMRMGAEAGDSVLAEWCQSRAVAGLYIADTSALPNSIGGANPTVTAQMLASRTSEAILPRPLDPSTKLRDCPKRDPIVFATVIHPDPFSDR